MMRAKAWRCGCTALALVAACAGAAWGSAGPPRATDLTELSLEELMGLQVTSVSRREERLFDAAGAVFVLTREDLRRSGVHSLPEALRLVPGMHVAQVNNSQWAISTRGFSDRFAHKVLVLVDGRSAYSDLFSGVLWEDLEIPLAEVESIEVMRGPGSALWGANAVNGVISIVTRRPRGETGGTVELGVENGERRGTVSREGTWGERSAWRFWGGTGQVDAQAEAGGDSAHDGRRASCLGLQLGRGLAQGDLSIDLGVRRTDAGQTTVLPALTPPYGTPVEDSLSLSGVSSLVRWTRRRPSGGSAQLLVFAEQSHREERLATYTVNALDVDFQSFVPLGPRHDLLWGGEIRRQADDFRNDPVYLSLAPARRTVELWNLFVQDQVTLAGGRSHLTLGSKAEHSEISGWSLMPSARLQVELGGAQSGWASVSRSARTAGRAEADVDGAWLGTVPAPDGVPVRLIGTGSRDLDTEEVVAWELGYRVQPGAGLSLDLAAFHHEYEHVLASCSAGLTPETDTVPYRTQLVQGCNAGTARAAGVETSLVWSPSARWRWSAAYSYLGFTTHLPAGLDAWTGSSPRHMAQLRLQGDPRPGWETDLALFYTDSLPHQDVPAVLRLDLRLERTLRTGLGLEIVGRNLLDDRHREFGSSQLGGIATEVRRSAGIALHWRY